MGLFEKKCDFCGKRIEEAPVNRYSRAFRSKEHVASYFDYIEATWNEVCWADFY